MMGLNPLFFTLFVILNISNMAFIFIALILSTSVSSSAKERSDNLPKLYLFNNLLDISIAFSSLLPLQITNDNNSAGFNLSSPSFSNLTLGLFHQGISCIFIYNTNLKVVNKFVENVFFNYIQIAYAILCFSLYCSFISIKNILPSVDNNLMP